MQLIQHYFPKLEQSKLEKLNAFSDLFREWNTQINMVSRKDTDFLEEKHILHSLTIAHYFDFQPREKVLDWGTGGGFPGIPLAVIFPETRFRLVDSIGKKIMVVKDIAEKLKLANVRAEQTRVEQIKEKYNYITSRAVAPVMKSLDLTAGVRKKGVTKYLMLKGGDLTNELMECPFRAKIIDLSRTFEEPFFETKKLVVIEP